MAFDNLKNFAISLVALAPSPATSGTSLTVTSGDGARFPAAPFQAVVWPLGAVPDPTNAEIVRVSAINGDVLTITRAQESSTARTVLVGDQIALAVTAKQFTDLQALVGGALVFGPTGVATPIGNVVKAGPAFAVMENGTLWFKTNTTADANNWNQIA